jgi:protein involved in polysaccharide export with SLBB domain
MQKFHVLVFLIVLSGGLCFAQSGSETTQQNSQQQPGISVDCNDPTQADNPDCITQQQTQSSPQTRQNVPPTSSIERVPQLRTPYTPTQALPRSVPYNPSQVQQFKIPPKPETEFEQMVADSAGRVLPLFGQSLFEQPPSTFAPIDLTQVPTDYIVGPGDELQIRVWGQIEADLRVIVDRAGQVYIPQVGQISVAGVHYGELEQHLKQEISKSFRNFNLTVNIGRLRSIQVFVVGYARYPGTYTISALSSLVNAVFASGGPSPQGSLRHIQVRRDGNIVTDFDFYDLLMKGDKSKDVRLQAGDVLYFPPVGSLVAISGSVNNPAIYEMKSDSTLNDLIEDAGDLSNVADTSKITIERLVDHSSRTTLEFPYDDKSRTTSIKDGDIVHIFSIVPRFQDTVTLRGNVANPGRYPWTAGMRIRDLIPDAQALLSRRYWRDRASIINGRATEYPIRPERPRIYCYPRTQQQNALDRNNTSANPVRVPELTDSMGDYALPEDLSNYAPYSSESNTSLVPCTNYQQGYQGNDTFQSYQNYQDQENPYGDSNPTDRTRSNSGQNPGGSTERALYATQDATHNISEDLRRTAPAINWDYAIIQRVNPIDLTSQLLWISPRKAILEKDEASNVELQAGDIVTIFSQRDMKVPRNERSQFVIVEGEVARPGVYQLGINETLRSVMERAGGLTPNAYIYGAQLTRESARIEQQKSLDELVRNMEVQVRQSTLSLASSNFSGDVQQVTQLQAAQEGVIAQLRSIRATGRIALPIKPNDKKITDFPDMVLEDSDRLTIPQMPSTVSVVGNVYNPGSFIYDAHTPNGKYLQMAGKGKPQSDLHHAFVLRANGVVVAANDVNGLFTGSKFDRLRLYPGDQIVVPYKLQTGALIRGLRDWSLIASQLAITGAALAVIH